MQIRIIEVPDDLFGIGDSILFYASAIENSLTDFQKNVKTIDSSGKDHCCKDLVQTMGLEDTQTIKVEGVEQLPGIEQASAKLYAMTYGGVIEGDITVHMFKACKGAPSFDTHTDPVDLIIYCIEGVKTMIVAGQQVVIHKGQALIMPANTPHKATNEHASIMLSIGFEY